MRRPRFIAEHARRPHGLLGRIVVAAMSRETYEDNLRAIDMLGNCDGESVTDVGTGHGRAVGLSSDSGRRKIAGLPIDFRPKSTGSQAKRK